MAIGFARSPRDKARKHPHPSAAEALLKIHLLRLYRSCFKCRYAELCGLASKLAKVIFYLLIRREGLVVTTRATDEY
jgi:hypothetical protein